jgi:aminoglycoside phosphotransferase (APT) family kinase protein
MTRHTRQDPQRAEAAEALRRALQERYGPGAGARVAYLGFLGEGLSYRVYEAECALPARDGGEQTLVVRVPRPDAEPDLSELAEREDALLRHLVTLGLPLRLPEVLASVATGAGLAMVQRFVRGAPLDTAGERTRGLRPWEIIARVAAVIHGVATAPLAASLKRHGTRRAHALHALLDLDDLGLSEARVARSWAEDHLPPDEPASLLHADLLGQNLRVDPHGESPLGVIDWQYAEVGDPAFDMAIVTRGVREPFDREGGMALLLQAYAERGGRALRPCEVQLHELCLLAGWLQDAAETSGEDSEQADQARYRFRAAVKRICGV